MSRGGRNIGREVEVSPPFPWLFATMATHTCPSFASPKISECFRGVHDMPLPPKISDALGDGATVALYLLAGPPGSMDTQTWQTVFGPVDLAVSRTGVSGTTITFSGKVNLGDASIVKLVTFFAIAFQGVGIGYGQLTDAAGQRLASIAPGQILNVTLNFSS